MIFVGGRSFGCANLAETLLLRLFGKCPDRRDLFFRILKWYYEMLVVVYPQFFGVTITQAARLTGRA